MTTKASVRVGARTVAPSRRVLVMPLALAVALGFFSLLPQAEATPRLGWSILGAAGALLAFAAAVAVLTRARALTFDVVLRPQHYLQACAHTTILLYWGWYWRPVYEMAPLIAAQLVFAYAFDMLLQWSRRDEYQLGFGPFPVIFSTNLFLWFKPEWFFLQFLMIAVGFAAKDLIRWERGGRRVHIFNPSSFTLALFSIGLLLTGTTSITYGPDIARTQFNPPNIYLVLFLIGLPGQFLFGVTTMTMSAVLTTYGLSLLYFAFTGTYLFIDAHIPIAVFLGMNLLFTDPSTAPRTELGRIFFGMMYGAGNVILYELLTVAGLPAFYDKLLPVPIMNLMVRAIDRVASSPRLAFINPARIGASLAPRMRNLGYITIWTLVFAGMSAAQGVGDHHPGHNVPFWQQACQQNAHHACDNLGAILTRYCSDGSGWACNELGALQWHGRVADRTRAAASFDKACRLGFPGGCQNKELNEAPGIAPFQPRPRVDDYPVILRTGKGALPDTTPIELFTRACDQGWLVGCEDAARVYLRGQGVPRQQVQAAAFYDRACTGGVPTACSDLGLMHYTGDGIPKDRAKGLQLLTRACDLGLSNACKALKDTPP